MRCELRLGLIWAAFSFTTIPASAQSIIDLSGNDWTLENPSLNISVPASLPSQAHLDLYAANVIGDPYWGLNDFNLRWIVWNNWTYTSAPISGLNSSSSVSTWLVFDGLDTFSTIDFCGQFVGTTENQFVQYYFDVSDVLASCGEDPVLRINFGSAPVIADAIAAEPGQEIWPYSVEGTFEFPNRQFIRKEQSDFGWDWGPAFAPAGPWRPAYVVQAASSNHEIYIRNTDLDIFRKYQLNNLPPDQSQPWIVNASLDFIGSIGSGASLNFKIVDLKNNTVLFAPALNITSSNETITGSITVDPSLVDLWWPNGLGAQTLYNITVSVLDSSNNTLATVTKRTGFRTIVLNENPISQAQVAQGIGPGNNWHFEINGKEFFAKGSNFIPPDAFWARVTPERIEQLFQSVTAGNQNMLRVWASGAYSPDFLYDIADEYGILCWSEFEFGDALYPTDSGFLDNVAAEILYNVRRVNHHPSLALWAGGNEFENLELPEVQSNDPSNYDYYLHQYEELFLNTILPIVYGNSKSISYMPSSTNTGWLSLNFSNPMPMVERYQNLTAGSYYGDTDYYNYNSVVAFNYSSYPIGRFANEFGFHSMPSLQSWREAVPASELYFNSSTVMLRNHHYPSGSLNASNYYNSSLGMGEMTLAVERYYPVPNKTDPIGNFSAWCLATQIFQADFYRSQIQFYRLGSGLPQRQLGTLYWQLEDIWQAPTWAGIEYDGRWKVLHYGAQDVYQQIIISLFYNYTTGDLFIDVISDLWTSASGSASLTWLDWSGAPIANNAGFPSGPQNFTVGGLNITQIYHTNIANATFDMANSVLILNVTATGSLPNTNTTTVFQHQNFFHPVWLNEAKLVDPQISLAYSNETQNFTLEAQSGVAVWTWLDAPAGVTMNFDSNAFLLLPGQPREVSYTVKEDSTHGDWIAGVTVQSLWNMTLPD